MAGTDPIAEAEVAPVADTVVAAEPVAAGTVAETAAEPAVTEEAPAEAATAAVTEEKAAEPAAADEPVEAKPEDAKPDVEAAPAEIVAPVYTEFKLPEGIQAAPEQLTAYNDVLGKHGVSQEAGQELMDLHATALKQAHEAMAQHQIDAFAETRAGWVKDFDKQAGNRRDTILNDAKFAITDTIKDTKERQALWDVLAFTGAGDHPVVINAFAKIAKRLRERNAPAQGLPTNGAKSGSPADRRYGSSPRR